MSGHQEVTYTLDFWVRNSDQETLADNEVDPIVWTKFWASLDGEAV